MKPFHSSFIMPTDLYWDTRCSFHICFCFSLAGIKQWCYVAVSTLSLVFCKHRKLTSIIEFDEAYNERVWGWELRSITIVHFKDVHFCEVWTVTCKRLIHVLILHHLYKKKTKKQLQIYCTTYIIFRRLI